MHHSNGQGANCCRPGYCHGYCYHCNSCPAGFTWFCICQIHLSGCCPGLLYYIICRPHCYCTIFRKRNLTMELFGMIVTGAGVLFLLLGSLGVFRMPDVYNIVQAGTKCTTLGSFLTIIGVGILQPDWFWKTLIIALFILISNPISSHNLGRASREKGIKLCDKSVLDKTNEFKGYKE